MRKWTNTIGSYIVAIIAVAFPLITGIGMANDWLDRSNVDGAPIHPWLTVLWILCVFCTLIEGSVLGYAISESE